MTDDTELARRSILGFGEMVAALGRCGISPEAEVRRPDALGARIDLAPHNPWFHAAVVPLHAAPPADDPLLPRCLWTVAAAVPGRLEDPAIATPCMGIALDAPALALAARAPDIEEPSLAVLGDMNERAYNDFGTFAPLVRELRDDRIRVHGLRDAGAFVCVALTFALGDDLGIHYVATEATHRRRGLASRLVLALLAAARDAGQRTATLQASADGLPVWERLGFRRVATLRGYLRPDAGM
ncbi:MAG TPA: GNAT family N-acetyltransferase [Candidatus Nanopelagicales bacterium]|nr:GNAT family N-acetyltransferase [Candidatus Nanopelagicales bacterium]